MNEIEIIDRHELLAAKEAFFNLPERERVAFHAWVKHEIYGRKYRKAYIPAELRWSVFKRDGMRCHYCGSHSLLTADHKTPEAKGGLTNSENLVTACQPCNSAKGTMNYQTFKFSTQIKGLEVKINGSDFSGDDFSELAKEIFRMSERVSRIGKSKKVAEQAA